MEDLIEEFLEELIDKNEITANERTDMKLTLLEAMPREMTEETKTRVMSSLKSKMETPSANIFTDKGVNIDAVRTIANESVKEVVKAVEKEEQERAEAEIKRDAKVSEAIDSIILDADKKSEEKDENISIDDGYYSDTFYNDIPVELIEQAYQEISEDCPDNEYTEEQRQRYALGLASYKNYNKKINEYVEQGLSLEEAREKAGLDLAGGKTELVEKQKISLHEEAKAVLKTHFQEAISKKISLDKYVQVIKEQYASEFVGVENFDNLVEEVFAELRSDGLHEYFISGKNDIEQGKEETLKQPSEMGNKDAMSLARMAIIKELLAGVSFDVAVEKIVELYEGFLSNIDDVIDFIVEMRESLLEFGFSEDELSTGRIPKDKIERYCEKNTIIPKKEEKETQESEKIQDDNENKSEDLVINLTRGINRLCSGYIYTPSLDDALQVTKRSKNINRQKADEVYVNETRGNRTALQGNRNETVLTSNIYNNERRIYHQKEALIAQHRNIDKEEIANGTISTERKNLIEQRNLYISKAIKVYMTGKKSAYEIVKELGEYAEKFEIMPEDIISGAINIVNEKNPKNCKHIAINERDLAEKYMILEAAKQTLRNSEKTNNKVSVMWIKMHIARLEKEINKLKSKTIDVKKAYGLFNEENSIELEQNLQQDIEIAYEYTNQKEYLIEMQRIFAEIQSEAKENNKSIEVAAREYFKDNPELIGFFDSKLEEALQNGEKNQTDIIPIIKSSIKTVNDNYRKIAEKKLANLERSISKSEKDDIEDIDYTESLLEKTRIERELQRADKRERLLTNSENENKRVSIKVRQGADVKAFRRNLALYFEKDVSLISLYESFKRKGIEYESNQLIKGIIDYARKMGIDDEKALLDVAKTERESLEEYIKIEGWKHIVENAKKGENQESVQKYSDKIKTAKEKIDANKQAVSGFKSSVREKMRALQGEHDINLMKEEDRRKLTLSKNKNQFKRLTGNAVLTTIRKNVVGEVNIEQTEMKINAPKKGVGLMNVAKILETSGTTSQEIVGEVTDLNKFARVQDERGISEDQRDS